MVENALKLSPKSKTIYSCKRYTAIMRQYTNLVFFVFNLARYLDILAWNENYPV